MGNAFRQPEKYIIISFYFLFVQTMHYLHSLWQLCLKEFRSLLGDRVMVALIIAMFGFVPFVIHEGVKAEVHNATVGVIDDDRSALSYRLRAALLPPYFKSVEEVPRNQADELMEQGQFIFLLDIPPNFEKDLIAGKNPKIQVATDATSMTIAAGGANYIEQIFRQEIAAFFHINQSNTPYEVVIRTHYNPNGDSAWYSTVMQICNNLAMLSVILVGAAVIREREHGTLEHLLVMPIDARQIALAKIIANGAVILLAGVLSMYFIVHLAIGIPINGSLALFALCAMVYLFATTALGILAATFAPTMPQLGLLVIPFLIVIQLTSGAMTPVESMPDIVQKIIVMNPAKHFVSIAQDIIFRGSGFAVIWQKMLIIAAMGLIFLNIALFRFRKMLEQQG
ncbi:MAG: ABC transporter permease [Neisseriaceae bacterium]|nr:ABC transporter permease [Neisseriaceae bacterium]